MRGRERLVSLTLGLLLAWAVSADAQTLPLPGPAKNPCAVTGARSVTGLIGPSFESDHIGEDRVTHVRITFVDPKSSLDKYTYLRPKGDFVRYVDPTGQTTNNCYWARWPWDVNAVPDELLKAGPVKLKTQLYGGVGTENWATSAWSEDLMSFQQGQTQDPPPAPRNPRGWP
jgi:hypothetical protein